MAKNNWEGEGRLTRDPEAKTYQGGMFVKFTIAIERPSRDGQNKVTDFVPCVAFNDVAEAVVQNYQKGSPISAEGRFTSGSYEDKNGQKHYTHEITVFSVGTRVYKNGIALLNHAEKQRANSQQGGYDQYQGASTQPGTGNFERFGEPAGPQYEEEEIPF